MRSLRWRLAGALLLMVVVSMGLMAYLTELSATQEFQQYMEQVNIVYTQSVANDLSQFYTQEQSWDRVQWRLDDLERFRNDRLIVADSSGVIVGDTEKAWLGRAVSEVDLDNGTPITVSGQDVGELYSVTMIATGDTGEFGGHHFAILDTAEQEFFSRVEDSVRMAAVIAAAVALLLGLILTLQITNPIRSLIRGARQIAKGDLGYRVEVKSRSELGDLAQSFNAMASSLDRGEQSRRRLIADIAHELRTPLTVIEGTVDGILDGVFEADHEHLDSIREQTALLARLTHDLRDLSLAESGQLVLELAPTDMVELIQRKLSQVEVKAREKNITLKLNAGREMPEINVDPMRIEQVITNLMTNAIRHTPTGGSVTISVETVPGNGSHHIERPSMVISFADTGKGIAVEHLLHVFERFYRVDTSRSRGEGGAGLGLAIVKQIVQAHGGQVWVESEPGKGSTFRISLPLADA